jgi:hypothetical protein
VAIASAAAVAADEVDALPVLPSAELPVEAPWRVGQREAKSKGERHYYLYLAMATVVYLTSLNVS